MNVVTTFSAFDRIVLKKNLVKLQTKKMMRMPNKREKKVSVALSNQLLVHQLSLSLQN